MISASGAQGEGYAGNMPPPQAVLGAGPSGIGNPVLPPNTGVFRKLNERNFAHNLGLLTPKPQGRYDAHHMLAQNVYNTRPEVQRVLNQVGMSINDPHWGTWWGRGQYGTHRREWSEFEQSWFDWLDTVDPNSLTFDMIIEHAESLAGQYGLDWSGDGFYY